MGRTGLRLARRMEGSRGPGDLMRVTDRRASGDRDGDNSSKCWSSRVFASSLLSPPDAFCGSVDAASELACALGARACCSICVGLSAAMRDQSDCKKDCTSCAGAGTGFASVASCSSLSSTAPSLTAQTVVGDNLLRYSRLESLLRRNRLWFSSESVLVVVAVLLLNRRCTIAAASPCLCPSSPCRATAESW